LAALLGIGTIWNFYAKIREAKEEGEKALEKMGGNPMADAGGEMLDAFAKSIGI
jgi:hypothetical protein